MSLRNQLYAGRFFIVGIVFFLIAIGTFAVFAHPLHSSRIHHTLPTWLVQSCLLLTGVSMAISGVIVMRWKHRGRILAVISASVLLVSIGLLGGRALYNIMDNNLVNSPVTVTNASGDNVDGDPSDSPLPAFLLIVTLYTGFSLLALWGVRKILKGDHRTRHRHHSHHAQHEPPPVEGAVKSNE